MAAAPNGRKRLRVPYLSAVHRRALFRLLRLLGSFAFFDDLLLRFARHFFVVAEGFRVHAPSAVASLRRVERRAEMHPLLGLEGLL